MGIVALLVFVAIVVMMGMWVNDQFTSAGYLTVGQQVATYLATCHVKLFMNNVTITPNIVLASLVEAVFTGYVAQAIATPAPPVNDATNGGFSTFLPSNVFTCTTAPGTPIQIFGWYLTDTGGNLIAAGNLPTPITIAEVGDSVPLEVALNYPG